MKKMQIMILKILMTISVYLSLKSFHQGNSPLKMKMVESLALSAQSLLTLNWKRNKT